MRTVQVYIEGQRLDLFEDEQINVTSTQQNVQDISKVFTDFSQAFHVPASPTNNDIFHHFYENDIGDFNDVNTLFDFNLRRNANIEIDYTPFRTGKMSLEKAEVKNNQAYSYQITFYGELVSLKDQFGNDKLVDLTFLNNFKHDYTAAEILDRITDGATDYKVRYPLIVDRNLTYGDTGSTDINPSTGVGAIHFDELFPAIKLISIFAAITSKYGAAFQGTFLGTKRFTNAFLQCQNSDSFVYNTPPILADMESPYKDPSNNNTSLNAEDFFNTTTETLTISQYNVAATFPSPIGAGSFIHTLHNITVSPQNISDASVTYYIDVHFNGQLVQTLEGSGGGAQTVGVIVNDQIVTPRNYQFFLRATDSVNLDLFIVYEQLGLYNGTGFIQELRNYFQVKASYAITAEISVVNYLPDMTVESFFSGILKQFNLTCYPIASDIYQIEPLSDWYAKGAVVDITQYTDIESINIDRVKLYENVEFKYQESESGTNTIFRNLTSRGYGSTSERFDYDGGDFKVELPFENMMMQKFVGTNLQIGETINTDGNKYTPKPMVLYMYDQLAAAYSFNNGAHTAQSQYIPFGQDVLDTNVNFTLNFNADISTLLDAIVPNTLFSVYYSPYISNLYNLKNRETSVKTNLPISLLTSLELNDRLIIRDKRYMINDMKSNLTTGEVSFTLLNDFSDVISQGGAEPIEPLQPSDGAQCLDVRILFPNGAVSAAITTTDAGVTITPSTLTTDGTVNVCIPANTDTIGLIVTEDDANYINTENFLRLRTEEGNVAIYTLTVTYTFANGTTVANQILIQQQP
jgi:hypothetical protein